MFLKKQHVTIQFIWAQRVHKAYEKNVFPTRMHYELIGEVYGPFVTPIEAAKALQITKSNQSKVKEILNGTKKSIEGFTFWYEGKDVYTFHVPDVSKGNGQLIQPLKHTEQTLQDNLKLLGFQVLSVGELRGTATKIKVACCKEGCSGFSERTYKEFVSEEAMPACSECLLVLKSHLPKSEKLFLYEVRPELAAYYEQQHNQGVPFTAWRKGSKTKILLTCPVCRYVQSEAEATTPNKYTTKKRNGKFASSYKCASCNSLQVKYPHLVKEWDIVRNGPLLNWLPFSTKRRVWWNCQLGHSWQANVDARTIMGSGCPQCALRATDSRLGLFLKAELRRLFPDTVVEDEAVVPGTIYRNDCVVTLASGQRLVFEMQGDYWHYDEKKLMAGERGLEHKDVRKLASNRAHGDLVFLINEHDLNRGRNMALEEVLSFALRHIVAYAKEAHYEAGCDVAYNEQKCRYALQTGRAYYVQLYNEQHETQLNARLHPKAKRFLRFQSTWRVFEHSVHYTT